jgi:hypothetical protein
MELLASTVGIRFSEPMDVVRDRMASLALGLRSPRCAGWANVALRAAYWPPTLSHRACDMVGRALGDFGSG